MFESLWKKTKPTEEQPPRRSGVEVVEGSQAQAQAALMRNGGLCPACGLHRRVAFDGDEHPPFHCPHCGQVWTFERAV